METKEILKHVDHTLLLQGSTWDEIKQICDDAVAYGTASVCIPPSYVKQAKEYLQKIVLLKFVRLSVFLTEIQLQLQKYLKQRMRFQMGHPR